MAVRLFARGSDGLCCIANAADESTFQDYGRNPLKNAANIRFHSNLDYLVLAAKFTTRITFAGVGISTRTQTQNKGKSTVTFTVPDQGNRRHLLGRHSLGYAPLAIATRGTQNAQTPPTIEVQRQGTAIRMANVEMDENSIYVQETWAVYRNSLPAFTETFNCWVFRNPE